METVNQINKINSGDQIESNGLETALEISLNITYTHIIEEYRFGNVPDLIIKEILKDGRAF